MNRIKYILISIVLLTGLFSSCSMEEMMEPVIAPEAVADLPDSVFFILEGSGPQTRVTYAGDGIHADFEKEDLVGCFALSEGLATAVDGVKQNACYRVSVHTNIGSGEDRRFLAPMTAADDLPKDAAGYMFYYPYNPDIESLDEMKSYAHTVKSDQNDRDRYEASDLLWDICVPTVSGDDRYVEVDMDHAMAQVIVEVESDLIADKTVPTLLNVPLTVSPIDLVKPSLDGMTEDMGEEGSYVLGQERSSIEMWEFGYATSGNLMFRAVIPANHSFAHGSVVVQLTDKETGNPKRFRINASMDFEPGKTYRMTLVKEREVVAPDEVDDDETWVYDVLDPETMEPVGLLCKEYIRYQPGRDNLSIDISTGTDYNETKYISSQAWVLYKMINGVPLLDTGYILMFINDVRSHLEESKEISSAWPDPHSNYYMGGLFTPSHGYLWVEDNNQGVEAVDGKEYLINYVAKTVYHKEYGMHGGTVQWDGTNNLITSFTMPTDEVKGDYEIITNEIAQNQGHIAVSEDGDPYLCYHPITADPPHKIGVLSPHYLVDRRVGRGGAVEERLYPLVKIGYNQFWMSLSLRASTQIDGTPLVNYNLVGSPGTSLPATGVKAGYMFPYKKLKQSEIVEGSTYTHYDPFNQMTPDEREKYTVSGMYNFLALGGVGMLPKSFYQKADYYMPMVSDMYKMHKYLGWKSAAKIMSRGVRARNNQEWIETEYEALRKGKYTHENYNNYTANICGFDLRAEGYYFYGNMQEDRMGNYAFMLLLGKDDNDPESMWAFSLPGYIVFEDSFLQFFENNDVIVDVNKINLDGSTCFAPLRFFMKFKGQADTGGVSVSSMGLATRSASSAPVEKRDVYVGLEAVEADEL